VSEVSDQYLGKIAQMANKVNKIAQEHFDHDAGEFRPREWFQVAFWAREIGMAALRQMHDPTVALSDQEPTQ
jgi:hypothetical protein